MQRPQSFAHLNKHELMRGSDTTEAEGKNSTVDYFILWVFSFKIILC